MACSASLPLLWAGHHGLFPQVCAELMLMGFCHDHETIRSILSALPFLAPSLLPRPLAPPLLALPVQQQASWEWTQNKGANKQKE
jgi:hypothetical protein